MKIQLGKMTICTVGRIKRKLKKHENGDYQEELKLYMKGVADSHWFGICVYRNNI